MRLLAVVLSVVLGSPALLLPGVPGARADVAGPGDPGPAAVALDPCAPQAGTGEEADAYERRQAESPAAGEFVGGHATVVGLLILAALVLLVVYLAKEIAT